ncbi:hypothetical protein SBBP1_1590003 [Burkholderiales bacterium]|nr:hypothetical protein SBBP1_1590003 [Burkholderiales bacterium]
MQRMPETPGGDRLLDYLFSRRISAAIDRRLKVGHLLIRQRDADPSTRCHRNPRSPTPG